MRDIVEAEENFCRENKITHKCLAFKRRSRPGLEPDEIGMGPVN